MSQHSANIPQAPRMSEAELELLRAAIPRGGKVLEFGSGGSTAYFFEHGAASLVSVESDRAFLEGIAAQPGLRGKAWLPIHASIGATGDWGYPAAAEPQAAWLNYHQSSWGLMPDRAFDLILIDGRFRVACLCQSLLRCENPEVRILIHDFWVRPNYQVALEHCEALQRAESSVLLRRKADIDWRALALTLQDYQFTPE